MCFILGITKVKNVHIIEAMKTSLINIWWKTRYSLTVVEDRVIMIINTW